MYKAQLTQTPQLTQKTTITPRLQQALKVLNMPLQELTHFIRQELEQNPFLELEEEDEGITTLEELDPASEWNEPEDTLDREDTEVDIDWDMAFEDRSSLSDRMSTRHADTDETPPEVMAETSLHDYLAAQLELLSTDIIRTETEHTIAEHILGNLNDDGKLEVNTLTDIAETVGCEITLVETILREIQDNFEPLGIAHRDTREALLIQIRNQQPEDISTMEESLGGKPADPEDCTHKKIALQFVAHEIIENYFNAFLNQQWHGIAEALNVDISVIRTVVKWIQKLSPYPGRYFTDPLTLWLKKNTAIDAITPDVEIQYLNGKYQAISVDSYIPRLQMNPYYLNLMRNRQDMLDAEAKEWIEKRYRDASNLLSSLAQRGSTIARVTEAIFEVQTEFLTQGTKSIKPLTLRTIAEKIGVHESTVSRVTSNKYVQTPHGMYPLRFFFSNELATTQGEAVSAKQVKNLIQEMVDAEKPTKPLSDQAISNALKTEGILLARRTVQKYRDELGIPTSRARSAAHAASHTH